MDHPRASVVILAWNEWNRTRDCLDSLRPTLSPHDEVIVVDNGSTDATARGLAQYGWVRVLTNDENRGFAAGCNQGAAAARGDVLVFLNNDTVLTPRWLEPLVAALDDPAVAAAGPRSNVVSGPQLVVDPAYAQAERRGLRRFAREWCAAHRGERTAVDRLVGFCLAVRGDAFAAVGGFDEGYGLGGFEDDDLCARLRGAGHELVIVHDSFVHHVGHATFVANGVDWYRLQQENQQRFTARHRARSRSGPLLSACMIVKDEEEMLPDCLASLEGLVDEVVVYDTGSSDATVEIARAAGATVLEGYWDDDFGRARNAALDACRGEWVLHVDADERVAGDPAALRLLLDGGVEPPALSVDIENLKGDGSLDVRHRATRLFRRELGRWEGRLHEQVVPRSGGGRLTAGQTAAITIRHLGYAAEVMQARGKVERNLRVAAAAAAAAGDAEAAMAHLNLARSLTGAGRHEEAAEEYAAARGSADRTSPLLPAVLHGGAETLLRLGRPTEALAWIEDLRAVGGNDGLADFLEGTARLLLGERADHLLTDDEVWNAAGMSVSATVVRYRRALALYAADRFDDAAEALLALAAGDPDGAVWQLLARAVAASGRPASDVADVVTDEHLRAVLTQLLLTPPDVADPVAAALWERWPGDPRLLGFAAHHGPRLEAARALEWAARLHVAGMGEHCPLVARARASTVAAGERVRSAAIAHGAFADARAAEALREAAPLLTDADLPAALVELDGLAPELLGPLVATLASIPSRRPALADALDAVGAAEQAALVRDLVPQSLMSAR